MQALSIGIEFLSRGCRCYFIDNDINSIKSLNENLRGQDLLIFFVYKNTAEN